MMRSKQHPARALVGALFAIALFGSAMLANTTALAACESSVDPTLHQTPVGDQVCGSGKPSPAPSATASPTTNPKPKPQPTPQQTPTGTTEFGPNTGFPPGAFPTAFPSSFGGFINGLPSGFPTPIATQTPALGSNGNEPFGQQYFPGTRSSAAHIKPGGGGFFALRAILFLLAAIAGAWTLYEARVRRWMVGI